MESIGLFIKNARMRKQVSLRELARLTNITPSWFTKVESGVIANPGAEHVKKIFDALDVHPKYLVKFGYEQGDLDADFIQNELLKNNEKEIIKENIKHELNTLDKESLQAMNKMLFKYRELMIMVHQIDAKGERLPITMLKEMGRFFQSEYAPK
jgi:transcriptional regulator with XRE-family HTH domain